MKSKIGNFLFSAFLLFLISCATQPQENIERKSNITNFTALGRVAINYPKCPQYQQCSQESLNASMSWTYQNNQDQISLFDPTGQERAKIIWNGAIITYQDKNGSESLTPEQLSNRLGFALPIEELRAIFLGKKNKLSDWQIITNDWQPQGYFRKLNLKKDKYQLKLLVNNLEGRS